MMPGYDQIIVLLTAEKGEVPNPHVPGVEVMTLDGTLEKVL
jgi:hypothetical protein